MKKITLLSLFLLVWMTSLFAQERDSVAVNKFLAYLDVEEKQIAENRKERIVLGAELKETEKALLVASKEKTEKEEEEKKIRLGATLVQSNLNTRSKALDYNKKRTETVNEFHLASTKKVELTDVLLSDVTREYDNLSAKIEVEKTEVEKQVVALRKQETKVHQLDVDAKKRKNSVGINQQASTMLAVSLSDASAEKTSLESGVSTTAVRIEKLEEEVIVQQRELEATEAKIVNNAKKLSENEKTLDSWEKKLKDVNFRIVNLENNRKDKKSDLEHLPDSLKTSAVLEATQEEVRMINDHLLQLGKEVKQLEVDITRLKEVSRVIKLENESLMNAKNINQSRLYSIKEDKKNASDEYKKKKVALGSLNENLEKMLTEKEKVTIALHKAENELSFYESEYEKRNTQLQTGKTEQAERLNRLVRDEKKQATLRTEKNRLSKEFNTTKLKNTKEKKELTILRNQRNTLETSVDSLAREKKQFVHHQKLADKELELILKKVNEIEAKKIVTNERLKELESTVEEDLLGGFAEARRGEYDEFLTSLEIALDKEPENAELHTLMGYTHYMEGHLDYASRFYNKAINETPDFVDPYLLRAELREHEENYSGALKDYNQVSYLDPQRGEVVYKEGVLLYHYLNKQKEACEMWEKALDLGVEKANEQITLHCSETTEARYFVMTQLTDRAVSGTYGFDPSNPIRVGRNKTQHDKNIPLFLELLRDSRGRSVKFVRYGSCCRYSTEKGLRNEGLLEKYRVSYRNENGKKVTEMLYFTFYDFETPKVPKGMETNHEIY